MGADTPAAGACRSGNPSDILVCGRPSEPYRIDPAVLEAMREREAPPPKPPLSADAAPDSSCVGPQHCGGGTIPLVGMALTAIKAAVLAARGDDWRDALRTREDEYRLHQEAEAKRAEGRRMRFGLSARN